MSLKNPKTQAIHHSWSGCCWKAPGLLEPFLAVGTNAVFPTERGARAKGFPRKLPSRFLEQDLTCSNRLALHRLFSCVSNSSCVWLISNMYLVFQRYLLADHRCWRHQTTQTPKHPNYPNIHPKHPNYPPINFFFFGLSQEASHCFLIKRGMTKFNGSWFEPLFGYSRHITLSNNHGSEYR